MRSTAFDHSYAVLDTPRTLKRRLDKCTSVAEGVKKRLKLSQQRERRLKTRVASLSEIVDDLRQKQLVSEDACKMLEKCFTGVPLEVMQRILKQSSDGEETCTLTVK
ncbi:hypothetical protein MRX96_046956 [Rhipicephalus microplus]